MTFAFARAMWDALTLALVFGASTAEAQAKFERRLPLALDGAFRVHNMVGSVTVRGWARDTVLVRAKLAAGERVHMGGGYKGAKMFVESDDDRNPQPTHLEVWVPSRTKLWVKTATANITVTGVAGGLDLYVVSGNIQVDGSPAELNAEAIDGDVRVTGSPKWLRAKSATGSVSLRGGSTDAALSTVSGPIRIEGGSFERMRAETVSGNITFSGQVDRSGVFDFDSHSGAVDVGIPAKSSASVAIISISGTIANKLTNRAPIAGKFGRGSELNMEVNAGGARVTVRTFKGPVTLRSTN